MGLEKTTFWGTNVLYSLPNIARVIKSRRMRWAWHAARMGDRLGAYRVFIGEPRETDNLQDTGVNRWEDNIMMNLQEVEAPQILSQIDQAQNRD